MYINLCTEHIEWDCREDPPMLGVCLGMWNFLDILHVRFMFIEPKWPADQDAWFTLQLAGCILWKISKHHESYTCTLVSEILTGLFSKSLMS